MSDVNSSRIEGFHKLAPDARLQIVARQANLDNQSVACLNDAAAGHTELADRLLLMNGRPARIVGDVTVVPGSTFDAPEPGMAEQALAELDALWQAQVAELEVEAGSDAAVRLARRRGATADGSGYRLHYTDAEIVADELAAFGPEVRVVSPEALAEGVRTRLERVASAHAEEGT